MTIRTLILWAALSLFAGAANAEVWQARYGVAETFNFKLYNADGTLDTDEADGGTEVSVSCNEGAETTATNDFVDEGTFYSIALTATEMQCERIAVVVAATTTEVFFIQTNGNSSAMTPVYEANVAQISTDSTAADNLELSLDDTAGAVPWMGIPDQGTAQAATSTTLQLRSAATFADDTLIGATVMVYGSTQGYWQSRPITDYVGSTDTATVDAWTVTPSGTITYKIFGTAPSSGGSGATAAEVWAYSDRQLTALDEDVTTLDLNATAVGSVAGNVTGSVGSVATDGITAASIAADAIGASEIAANAIGASEIADSSIDAGSIATDAITAAKIAADAIGASEIAADAIGASEIANNAIDAASTAADFSTEVQDADVESVNGVTINGDGGATPFGP